MYGLDSDVSLTCCCFSSKKCALRMRLCLHCCAVMCIGTCEVPLGDLWAGTAGDILSRDFSLAPAQEGYSSAGVVRVSLVAARALAALRAATGMEDVEELLG